MPASNTHTTSAQGDIPANAGESLAIIEAMMTEGRNRLGFDGKLIALWGALLTIAFVAIWASVKEILPFGQLTIWSVILVIGWALSIFIGRQEYRNAPCMDNPILRGYNAA